MSRKAFFFFPFLPFLLTPPSWHWSKFAHLFAGTDVAQGSCASATSQQSIVAMTKGYKCRREWSNGTLLNNNPMGEFLDPLAFSTLHSIPHVISQHIIPAHRDERCARSATGGSGDHVTFNSVTAPSCHVVVLGLFTLICEDLLSVQPLKLFHRPFYRHTGSAALSTRRIENQFSFLICFERSVCFCPIPIPQSRREASGAGNCYQSHSLPLQLV